MIKKILFLLVMQFMLCSCNIDNEQVLYFVGDSMIANWDVEAAFPNRITKNWGIDGSHVGELVEISITDTNADVVILVGTNDLHSNMSDVELTEYCDLYENCVCRISDGRIVVISVLPTSDIDKNRVIQKFNIEMEQRLKACTNVTFIDCYNTFLDKDGLIKEDLSREGLHLNDYGYILLGDKVKETL